MTFKLNFNFIVGYRESLKIPRLVINNHKSFIRVVEIPAGKIALLEGNKDFVQVESTSGKVRYSTLKLQELNAKLKALQEENEQVQRALSEDLCNQVQIILTTSIVGQSPQILSILIMWLLMGGGHVHRVFSSPGTCNQFLGHSL